MAMKLFGTALLFLALFRLRCAGEETGISTPTTAPAPAPATAAPAPTAPAPATAAPATTPTSNNRQNVSGSSAYESSPNSTVNSISRTPNTTNQGDTFKSANPTNSSTQQTPTPTTVRQSTSNGTATRMVASPKQTLTSPSSLTPSTRPGHNGMATARHPVTPKSTAVMQPETPENDTNIENQERKNDTSYSGIILPVIIALIVITFTVFLLMALYRMCFKTAPERQENGTEHSMSPYRAPLDKENVKLISVKTTSPEIGMSRFLALSSYDLPLNMPLPLECYKPMRAVFSREE
ncbi:endomucin isoform X2 [Varanus komodoensis]|uniref:endomucin isoform X2 n=1 Tax=Varanus komodoensis TaxID=61221 RepID=UPI001CF7D6E7|nr:endomucin isoform X2 [Varanus komodoensis]